MICKSSNEISFNFWYGLFKCGLCTCLKWYYISYCLFYWYMRPALSVNHRFFFNFLFWNDYRLTHWESQKQYKASLESLIRFSNDPHGNFPFPLSILKHKKTNIFLMNMTKLLLHLSSRAAGRQLIINQIARRLMLIWRWWTYLFPGWHDMACKLACSVIWTYGRQKLLFPSRKQRWKRQLPQNWTHPRPKTPQCCWGLSARAISQSSGLGNELFVCSTSAVTGTGSWLPPEENGRTRSFPWSCCVRKHSLRFPVCSYEISS